MKILFIFFFSSFSFILSAQSNQVNNDLDSQLQQLSESYNLNEQQAEKVKFLLLDKQAQLDAALPLKTDYKLYSAERFKINSDFNSSLNNMLTEEQVESFKEHSRLSRTQYAKESKNGSNLKVNSSQNNGSGNQKKN